MFSAKEVSGFGSVEITERENPGDFTAEFYRHVCFQISHPKLTTPVRMRIQGSYKISEMFQRFLDEHPELPKDRSEYELGLVVARRGDIPEGSHICDKDH